MASHRPRRPRRRPARRLGRLHLYESQERFEIRETGGPKSYVQRAYVRDSDGRFRRLKVFYELRSGNLWQGKLIPDTILEHPDVTYPIAADTTTTYYAGAGDGDCGCYQGSSTWDYVHDETDSDTAHPTTATARMRSFFNTSTNWCEVYRSFFPINTAALPDLATITAATFYVYASATPDNTDDDGDDFVTIVQTSQADPTTLTTADYDQCGDVDDPDEGIDSGDRVDISGLSTVAYTAFPLNSTGIGWISKTGYTLLGVREGHDVLDNSPVGTPGNNSVDWYCSEQTGTSEDPYISITYTVPVPPKYYHYAHH